MKPLFLAILLALPLWAGPTNGPGADGKWQMEYPCDRLTNVTEHFIHASPHWNLSGRIERSRAAKKEFMCLTGYPKGRPGYVVDHIFPLKRGGPDCPCNMQWQTTADGVAKDKTE